MSTHGIILDVEQGTERWAQERCGRITASRCGEVIATTKKGEAAARRDYRTELIIERLTGVPVAQYVSREMQWGLFQEPFARAMYEITRGIEVDQAGFVVHPHIPYFGCSPDGLVGDDGMIQIKCPNTTTHLAWWMAGAIPLEHIPQMLAELAVTGRRWVDFVSFDPRLPERLQLFVRRYTRDEKHVASMETEVVHFNGELEGAIKALPAGPQPVAKLLEFKNSEEVEF